jgi:hypothetical protein
LIFLPFLVKCLQLYVIAINKRTWSQTIELFYSLAKLTVEFAPEFFSLTLLSSHILQHLLFCQFVLCYKRLLAVEKVFIRGNMANYKNFETRRLIGNIAWLNKWSFAASLPISPRWNFICFFRLLEKSKIRKRVYFFAEQILLPCCFAL